MQLKELYSSFKKFHSLSALAFIFLFLVIVSSSFHLWNKNRVIIDGPSYYTYLPAVFIHQDLHLNFIDVNPSYYKDKIWYYKIENGNKLIKHPLGLSLALSPFFLTGHVTAISTGNTPDGYSMPYQNAMTIGVWVYLLLGLFYLRKVLLNFFSETITAITLVTIVIGTNLLWYSTFEAFMPHAVSFALLCICMYNFFYWLKDEHSKHLYAFAFCFGLIVLIRPLAITTSIYFLIIGIGNKGGINCFFQFLFKYWKEIIVAGLISGALISLQFFYWKYITGKWVYDVYINEHFMFNSPQIIPFLFSFRKGIFIYTPVLLFSLIGLIIYVKNNKSIFFSTLIVVATGIYILSSWWAWSYGISWGIRPMIDYYSFFSLPLAMGIHYAFTKNKILRICSFVLLPLLIFLNLFQTWQYKKGFIHFDDMSKEAYFKGFFQTSASLEWYDLLKPYNWQRRIAGLPQIEYSKELINSIGPKQAVYFRGANLRYLSIAGQSILTCDRDKISSSEKFYITRLQGDVVVIKSESGKYLSVKPDHQNIIVADAYTIGNNEQFVLTVLDDNDNRITLQLKSSYLSIDEKSPLVIVKEGGENTKIFRLFLFEDYQQK